MSRCAPPEAVIAGDAQFCVMHGDSARVAPRLAAMSRKPPAAAIITDPPGAIDFLGASWDTVKGGRQKWSAWLASIFAPAREMTRDGGRILAWSFPRTAHWTGCAVEDAGWRMEDLFVHLHAQGWNKSASRAKPMLEPWWLARTGSASPLNLDAVRVGDAGERVAGNCVLEHAPDCTRGRCTPGCVAALLDAESGPRPSGAMRKGLLRNNLDSYSGRFSPDNRLLKERPHSTGGASRFFPQVAADDADTRALWRFVPKARGQERAGNSHPTVKPLALMRWFVQLTTRPGDLVVDYFGGSGTTGEAALGLGRRVILVDTNAASCELALRRCTRALEHAPRAAGRGRR